MHKLKWTVVSAVAAAVLPYACTGSAEAAIVDVVELTADEIKDDLLNHTYTARQLVESYLERIDQYESTYNAFTVVDAAGALAQADALDAQIAANASGLAGKPILGSVVVIKDSMNVEGLRTTAGYSGFVS